MWAPVSSGVPQGAILGPLLFLIYVNDIGRNLQSTSRLFADDCTLYREIISIADCKLLQQDLNKLYTWSQLWQLPLNLSKCKTLCITNKRNSILFTYHLNNTPLVQVSSINYLGLTVNRKLCWREQVNKCTNKASKILNMLRCSLHECGHNAKKRAYSALVRPHLEACVAVWSPHQRYAIDDIEKVQKKVSRWICAKWDRDTYQWTKSYDECCAELRWMTQAQRRHYLICCQVYKILNSLANHVRLAHTYPTTLPCAFAHAQMRAGYVLSGALVANDVVIM